MPLSYSHEYMDLVFFFKAINGLVVISDDVLLKPKIPTRVTRCSSTKGLVLFPAYITRVTRVWNRLPTDLRQPNICLSTFTEGLLRGCYSEALHSCFDAEDPRTWKSVCLKCNSLSKFEQRYQLLFLVDIRM